MSRGGVVVLFGLLHVSLLFGVAGCGKHYEEAKKAPRPEIELVVSPTATEKIFKPVPARSWDGVLKGRVRYRGKPPERLRSWQNHLDCCRGDKDPDVLKYSYPFLVDEEGGLAEVVVFLRQPKTAYFLPTPEALRTREDHVVFKSPYCVIVPRVAVHVPAYRDEKGERARTGQKLILNHSSKILHNLSLHLPNSFGEAADPFRPYKEFKVEPAESPVWITCSIHPWMRAHALSLDHPFAAITDSGGRFEIRGLPTCVPVEVVAWHPEFGYLGKERRQGRSMKFIAGTNEFKVVVEGEN